MSKHTSGPLYAGEWDELMGSVAIITDPDNTRSSIGCAYDCMSKLPRETVEANAALWAAAPDLLEACKEFVRKVECGEARSTRSYTQMKAATAKAEELVSGV